MNNNKFSVGASRYGVSKATVSIACQIVHSTAHSAANQMSTVGQYQSRLECADSNNVAASCIKRRRFFVIGSSNIRIDSEKELTLVVSSDNRKVMKKN